MGSLDTNSRENTRITLGLLEAVESGKARTQRGLAVDLGIALGLVNVGLTVLLQFGLRSVMTIQVWTSHLTHGLFELCGIF